MHWSTGGTTVNAATDARHVLAALDGSAADGAILDWAVDEAVHRRLPLRLTHVIAEGSPARAPDPRDVIGAARALVTGRAPELPVEERLPAGSVVPALLAEAAAAGLVVLGSGQRADPAHLRLGSVALHVTTHAPGPVVVARAPLEGEPAAGPNTGRVVVGTDGSAVSEDAVGFAFEEAAWRLRGLTVVHAWQEEGAVLIDGANGVSRRELQEGRALANSLRRWREKHPDVAVVERLVADHPVRALIEESAGALVLVVGCHGHGRFSGLLLGSVSQAVLRHAATNVAVVRPHGKAE
jgi:nucleotide-binding universal stress UspA family protein